MSRLPRPTVFAWLAAFCCCTIALAGPCETEPDFVELRIVTYNIKGGLGPVGTTAWNSVGDMITTIDEDGEGPDTSLMPDVVCFQEVDFQNQGDLIAFRNAFLPGYSIRTASGDGFNYNAILFRPELTLLGYTNLSTPGPRHVNRATFQVAGAQRTVTIYNAHFKCCGDQSSQNTRRAEADRIGEEIWRDRNLGLDLDNNGSRETEPGWVILCGDLNADTLDGDHTLDGVFFYDDQNQPTGVRDLPVESWFGRVSSSLRPNTIPSSGGYRLDNKSLDVKIAMVFDVKENGA
ncbi:MAG: endonuclease/exonuclease/phosphatase family protein, partial [Phycisphaerales bacterium JB050]